MFINCKKLGNSGYKQQPFIRVRVNVTNNAIIKKGNSSFNILLPFEKRNRQDKNELITKFTKKQKIKRTKLNITLLNI